MYSGKPWRVTYDFSTKPTRVLKDGGTGASCNKQLERKKITLFTRIQKLWKRQNVTQAKNYRTIHDVQADKWNTSLYDFLSLKLEKESLHDEGIYDEFPEFYISDNPPTSRGTDEARSALPESSGTSFDKVDVAPPLPPRITAPLDVAPPLPPRITAPLDVAPPLPPRITAPLDVAPPLPPRITAPLDVAPPLPPRITAPLHDVLVSNSESRLPSQRMSPVLGASSTSTTQTTNLAKYTYNNFPPPPSLKGDRDGNINLPPSQDVSISQPAQMMENISSGTERPEIRPTNLEHSPDVQESVAWPPEQTTPKEPQNRLPRFRYDEKRNPPQPQSTSSSGQQQLPTLTRLVSAPELSQAPTRRRENLYNRAQSSKKIPKMNNSRFLMDKDVNKKIHQQLDKGLSQVIVDLESFSRYQRLSPSTKQQNEEDDYTNLVFNINIIVNVRKARLVASGSTMNMYYNTDGYDSVSLSEESSSTAQEETEEDIYEKILI